MTSCCFSSRNSNFFLPQPSSIQWIKMNSPYCNRKTWFGINLLFIASVCASLVLGKSSKPFLRNFALKFFFFSLRFLFHTLYTILMTFSKNFTVRMKSFTFQPIFWKIFFPLFSFWLQFLSLSGDIYWFGYVSVCMVVWISLVGEWRANSTQKSYEQTPACNVMEKRNTIPAECGACNEILNVMNIVDHTESWFTLSRYKNIGSD